MYPWHMGPLHPFETVLTLLLAFGPFVVLGVVIVLRRRQDAREEDAGDGAARADEVADPQDVSG